MKLVAEVVGAYDLPARRSRGGVNPFVQVDFGGQRQATRVRPGEANPTWNEALVFAVDGHGGLSNGTVLVTVYHRRSSGGKSCLGRVRLFGTAATPSAEEAVLLRCPLDKPGFFFSSPARGEVALRLYMAPYASAISNAAAAGNVAYSTTTYATTLDSGATSDAGPETVVGGASTQSAPITTRVTKTDPVRVFHAMPPQSSRSTGPPPTSAPPRPPQQPPLRPPQSTAAGGGTPKIAKKAAAATGDDAKAAAYLMVDKLEFLYVNVVRGRALPGMDLTFGIDPYVEVRVGNYFGVTRHNVRNHNPEWDQVFAFPKEKLQADKVEVIVKDRNVVVRDGFVGKVSLTIAEVPSLAPPNRPLAPQWYALKGAGGQPTGGEIMVAAWKGSQSDEAFAGALHAGAHDDLAPAAVLASQTKTYFTPRLCYLRCHVMAAQDLIGRRSSAAAVFVTVQLGAQWWRTRPSLSPVNPKWDEDFFLVAAWPFEEPLSVTVVDAVSPDRHEVLGRLVLPKGAIKTQQFDKKKFSLPAPSWFDLERPTHFGGDNGDHQGGWNHAAAFRSKIQLRVYYDAAYHVLDELTTYASDFQPSARPLRSPAVGVLELAILRATGLPSTMKPDSGGRRTVNAYCVARYGQKWIRTRMIRDTATPSWQEQFAFDVFDPCTVLTIAVFDNNQLLSSGFSGVSDAPLGKVRIRVSTLSSGRTYDEHPYSLFVVRPGGLLRCGELHIAVRFTLTAWSRTLWTYLRPTLPNQHFAKPIPPHLVPALRHHAVDVVASRLARAEPPLGPEAVRYLLRDPAAHPSPAVPEFRAYSMRRSLAALTRLRDVLAPAVAFGNWFAGVRDWDSPATTVLVTLLFLTLTLMPQKILPTFFLYLFAVGAWNFRRRPTRPPQMEHYADGVPPAMLEEEFDAGPASGTPTDVMEHRYWRLREVATNVQMFLQYVAGLGERVQALLAWKDRRATAISLVAVAALGGVFYAVPLRNVVAVLGVYVMRPPLLRRRKGLPSPLINFFRRLPTEADLMF